MDLWSVQVPLGRRVEGVGEGLYKVVQRLECGRSMGIASYGCDEDQGFFVAVFSPPQDKAILPNPHHGCGRRQGKEPWSQGGLPAVCKCHHLPAPAPLPLWATAGLPVWPPEGVRSKWAGNSIFTSKALSLTPG